MNFFCNHILILLFFPKIFAAILKFKLNEDYFYPILVKDDNSLQYFDKEVLTLCEDEVFIDCGAYTGYTIAYFLKVTNEKFKHIYSYEPEKNTCPKNHFHNELS